MYISRREKGVGTTEKKWGARMCRKYDEAWNCSSNLPFKPRDMNCIHTFRKFKFVQKIFVKR